MKSSRWIAWLTWFVVLALVHFTLLGLRDEHARQAHVALIFLLVVLGGSASGARGLGAALATVAFLLINYYYQKPFGTMSVDKSLDWVVLITFLATAFAATELVQRARDEASRADARADEVLRLTAEAKRAEALEEADRLKDALLASVSHDLRTPLTNIRALADEGSGLRESVAVEIVAQVDRLDRMVRDILEFSRLRAGPAATLEVNAVEDVIGATLRQFAGAGRDRRLRGAVDDGEVLAGRFDFVSTMRALTNLIDNALRYSPSETAVEIRGRQDGQFIAIDVADRGAGVPAGEEERVFLPFYRPVGFPPDAGNAGLGLAIVRQIAVSQGGSVQYARREGGGSQFTLRLLSAEWADDSRGS